MNRLLLRLLAVLAALLLPTTAVAAELRALLVGVSSYPTLDQKRQLSGPRHDVLQLQQVLLQRGFAPTQIALLADGVAGAGLPTRANILTGLQRLAEQAQRGDTVYLHVSAHGSRQPARPGSGAPRLLDGTVELEATVLPQDIGSWDGRQHSVANAIRAAEWRAAVDRIRARGAFVWAVFDVCHAARLVRGAAVGAAEHQRHVEPEALGVPAALLARAGDDAEATALMDFAAADPAAAAEAAADLRRGGAPAMAPGAEVAQDAGRTALFYAAQADQVSSDLLLPVGRPGAVRRGLFSHLIAEALLHSRGVSYRQLAQAILAGYRAVLDARATPLFSGNGLDTVVLGQHGVARQQWPLQHDGSAINLPVGSLAGLAPGAVLAVLPDALADDRAAIGHLMVQSVAADRAELRPHAHAGLAAPDPGRLRSGLPVRLLAASVNLALHIVLDRSGCAEPCLLDALASRLRREGVAGVAAVWLADDAAGADVVLQRAGDRIVLRPAGRVMDTGRAVADLPGIALQDNGQPRDLAMLAQQLAVSLHAVARTRNLLRVAASALAAPQPAGLEASLQARLVRVGGRPAAVVPGGAGLPVALGRTPVPVSPGTVPRLHAGDSLLLTLGNRGLLPLDVTALYLDASHGVLALFPDQAGSSNRLDPGMQRHVEIDLHAPPAGTEYLLVIAVEARRLAEPRDYSFLQQPPLARRSDTDSVPFDAFADAAFAEHRRRNAAAPAPLPAATAVQLFTLSVQP